MAEKSQTNAHAAKISTETERAVRDFVREAVSHLNEALEDQAPEWGVDSRWERGADGHFREHIKRWNLLLPISINRSLHSLPGYDACVEQLKSDAVVGPHLDCLVGTRG